LRLSKAIRQEAPPLAEYRLQRQTGAISSRFFLSLRSKPLDSFFAEKINLQLSD
jgi:hypothetical protein